VSRRRANRRIRLLVVVFTIAFAGMLVRAAWLQGVQAHALDRLARGQHRQVVTLPARRGTIFDRKGFQLAIGEQATTVYADPRRVRDPRAVALAAARHLGVDPAKLYRQLQDRSRAFLYVARQADPERAAALRRGRLLGLGFYPEERRVYPQGSVAAQVVGYAGVDNNGLTGIELGLDGLLAGRAGRRTIVKDPVGRVIDVISSTRERAGRDVVLTIDGHLQANVEEILGRARTRWRARAATAILLDPRSGDVLAMANAPRYDANDFPRVYPILQRNRAVEATYEPGSTLKVVTVAGALSERLVTPRSSFNLPPVLQVADRKISDSVQRDWQTMTVAQIVAQSSNVGAVTLARLLGSSRLASWIERFGFGRKTGVDFPAESPGIVPPLGQWSGSTIGTLPIGHGIAVTPIQMAAAYAAIANRGMRVQPHLVDRIAGRPALRPKRRRVLRNGIAAQMRAMLQGVVVKGTGQLARVPGYQVAGKTGTAAKPEATGGYSRTRYVASFAGFVPASEPRLVIVVAIDEPKGAIYGGVVAAPVFRDIAEFALQYLEVPPDTSR
jgi:cell division protein FtsI (penicillin-binding protein 3)